MASFTIFYDTFIDAELIENGIYELDGKYWDWENNKSDFEKDREYYSHKISHKNGEYTLREAIDALKSLGITRSDSFTALSSGDPDSCYNTGEETYYSVFFNGVTPASLRRICRLFED